MRAWKFAWVHKGLHGSWYACMVGCMGTSRESQVTGTAIADAFGVRHMHAHFERERFGLVTLKHRLPIINSKQAASMQPEGITSHAQPVDWR